MSLLDIAFPYRAHRSFGVASFAFVFLLLVVETEMVVLVALAIVAHRLDLFVELQPAILPAAALVSLVASGVFAWRARAWTKSRIEGLREYGGPAAASYAEKLTARRITDQP